MESVADPGEWPRTHVPPGRFVAALPIDHRLVPPLSHPPHIDCSMPAFLVEKLVSGGQTGADRAALDIAMALGLPHGGWCPKGRKAEDGTIPLCYALVETPCGGYPQRTEWNVRDSDGTAVFTWARTASGGSRKTISIARGLGRPCLHIARDGGGDAATLLRDFIVRDQIAVLNVAGSRESKEPGIGDWVRSVLTTTLSTSDSGPRHDELRWRVEWDKRGPKKRWALKR